MDAKDKEIQELKTEITNHVATIEYMEDERLALQCELSHYQSINDEYKRLSAKVKLLEELSADMINWMWSLADTRSKFHIRFLEITK